MIGGYIPGAIQVTKRYKANHYMPFSKHYIQALAAKWSALHIRYEIRQPTYQIVHTTY